MAPERLSSRKSFSLEEEFLDTSDSLVRCVLHQNNIVFIQALYENAMQINKLNSLLEATRGSDKKDTSNLTIACVHHSDQTIGFVQKLFPGGETRSRTEVFKSHQWESAVISVSTQIYESMQPIFYRSWCLWEHAITLNTHLGVTSGG